MDILPFIDHLDRDVVQRITSRREALGRIATLSAGVASLPVLFGALAQDAFGRSLPAQVNDVLNFALTLEYLEDEYYATGLATSGLIPASTRAVFEQISKHESAHVTLLRDVLGSAAVAKPAFDFSGAGFDPFSDYDLFLALAQGFEDTGVRAYKGQADQLIDDGGVLTVALQIHSVEARHAAQLRRLRGQKGWIVADDTDVQALEPIYAGEQAVTQGGVDLEAALDFARPTVTESFDEPLAKNDVLTIAGLFLA